MRCPVAPGDVPPGPEGALGEPLGAPGPTPGRALSIRFRRDIGYTPIWPCWPTISTRRGTCPSGATCVLPLRALHELQRLMLRDGERPVKPGSLDCSTRTGRLD